MSPAFIHELRCFKGVGSLGGEFVDGDEGGGFAGVGEGAVDDDGVAGAAVFRGAEVFVVEAVDDLDGDGLGAEVLGLGAAGGGGEDVAVLGVENLVVRIGSDEGGFARGFAACWLIGGLVRRCRGLFGGFGRGGLRGRWAGPG